MYIYVRFSHNRMKPAPFRLSLWFSVVPLFNASRVRSIRLHTPIQCHCILWRKNLWSLLTLVSSIGNMFRSWIYNILLIGNYWDLGPAFPFPGDVAKEKRSKQISFIQRRSTIRTIRRVNQRSGDIHHIYAVSSELFPFPHLVGFSLLFKLEKWLIDWSIDRRSLQQKVSK